MIFIWSEFYKRNIIHQSLKLVWKLLGLNFILIYLAGNELKAKVSYRGAEVFQWFEWWSGDDIYCGLGGWLTKWGYRSDIVEGFELVSCQCDESNPGLLCFCMFWRVLEGSRINIYVNTLRPELKWLMFCRWHVKCVFLKEMFCILIQISMKFVP